MRRTPLRLVPGLVLLAPAAVVVVAACADTTEADASPGDAGKGSDARRESSSPSTATETDAGQKTTCELTRAYFEGCENEGDLNCGANFDTWCAANDKVINSNSYRRAQAVCLTDENCDGKDRRDCEYEHYNGETPTASQKALVKAYCETCEPADVSACTETSTTYDRTKGIGSVGDIFVAAWELDDSLVDEIKTSCTGAAASDAGADTGACAKAFASCAGAIYISNLPDCPK
jgi:hypothetical protein